MSTLVQSAPIPEGSFRQHYPRQQNQKPQLSYTAAVPVEESETTAAPGSSQPTLYKQINIIPGLDADNAVVDTGIKMVRPTGGQVQVSVNTAAANEFDGKRMRRSIQRRTVDYNASAIQMLKHRLYKKSVTQKPVIHPDPLYYVDIVQPRAILENPINSVTTRFVRASTNKIRCPVFTVAWTPEGRRVVTGTSSGEFTLWNGLTFNFETILQAHESAVRAMEWSNNDMWLLSGDHNGVIKYWQSNMNNVKMIQAHTDPIRGLSFCPTDNKFVTCSDDGLLKVWDFYRCQEEETLKGHGADVKCCGWHPSKSLIASGSKDSQQPMKLWDPRTGASLATIHGHKSTVMDLQWNKNGNWILTGSRDRLLKVYDIRMMKDLCTFRGHKKEAASVNWHPLYEEMFASGGSDGSIMFWLMGCEKELGVMDCAHDGMIWDLKWHPLGHILCSGSNDHTTKFWTRNRPADKMRDKYNLNVLPTGFEDDYEYELPDSSQSDGAVVVSDTTSSSINKSTPVKVKTEKVEGAKVVSKTDLNTPAVKALLDQTSLKVSKPDSTDAPAQVYTLSQLRPTAPAFKIDSSKQKQAIDEVERLEKRRERQLRKGMDKGRKRSADSDDDTCDAPSLLDLDIALPAFLQEQEMKEQMDEANKRSLQSNMPPYVQANEPPRGDMPPRGDIPPSNWTRNDNGLIRPPFPENENRNFEGPIRPQFHGVGPEGPPNFDRPPQSGPPVFDRPPQGGHPNFDRPLQGNPPNFDRPPEVGPSNFDRPPSNGPPNFNRPPQSFNGPRPDDIFMDGPRPNEHFPNRPPGQDFDNRPRADVGFVDGPPPRSIADFGNRPPMDENFNVQRPDGDFVNRPRQDGDVPPGPTGDFDKRPRTEEEFNHLPPRLAGDFDLRPLPDVDYNTRQRPAGDFDKRPPPNDNFPRPDIDGPRFGHDRPYIQGGMDGPPSNRFNNNEGPPRMHNEEPRRPLQFNGPIRFDGPPVDNRGPPSGPPQHNEPIRFDGPPVDNRGPPSGPPQHNAPIRFDGPPVDNRGPPSGPPQHNAPFEGPPDGPQRMDERFPPRDNFPHQKRWEDERIADRWQDENAIPNRRPNEVNPINEPGPNWENMDREGLNRENRENRERR